MEYPQNLTASERHWFDLIHQCRTSGKSDVQWMREHEIKLYTFCYRIKQLRKKARDIPENSFSRQRNDVQEVVPLFMEEPTSIMSHANPSISTSITHNPADVRLNVRGITVEITNDTTQEVIKNTISALQFLC